MNQDNPFAKLGALDQQLYQDTKTHDDNRDNVTDARPAVIKENTSLLANQQTSKPAKKKTSIPANLQTSKLTNQQTSTMPLSTKEKKKYGTYLREDWIYRFMPYKIKERTMRYYRTL